MELPFILLSVEVGWKYYALALTKWGGKKLDVKTERRPCCDNYNHHWFYLLSFFLIESEEFGPVFIQEPDDVIYPLDSDEKKVVMHCEARGNPPPTYRFDTRIFVRLLIAVLLLQLSFIRNILKSPILLVFQLVHQSDRNRCRGRLSLQLH